MKFGHLRLPGLRVVVLAAGWICLPMAAVAGSVGNFSFAQVPTLDGVGLASLAGALAMAGAWFATRNRNSKK